MHSRRSGSLSTFFLSNFKIKFFSFYDSVYINICKKCLNLKTKLTSYSLKAASRNSSLSNACYRISSSINKGLKALAMCSPIGPSSYFPAEILPSLSESNFSNISINLFLLTLTIILSDLLLALDVALRFSLRSYLSDYLCCSNLESF